MNRINRRQFSVAAGGLAIAARSGLSSTAHKRSIAVVGHTGRGDFGHGLHTMWLGIPETQVVGVSDPDPAGLEKAVKALGGPSGFNDYRKMFQTVRPEIVAIGMRHVDQHREVALAAIEAGVRGLYIEKPFCGSAAEANEIVSAAAASKVAVAVAHRNRYHPALPVVRQLIAEKAIGRVLEYRMRGKEDPRGGLQDLWVLGSHLTNLVHYLAGRPVNCSATILIDGRPVVESDPRQRIEGIDGLVGNEVHARYEMENGIPAFFDSIAKAGNAKAGFGLQVIGTEGIIDFRIDREPLVHIRQGSPFNPVSDATAWIPISSAGVGRPEPIDRLGEQLSKHWVAGRDLIAALDEERPPLCSGADAQVTIEMITAVARSHARNGERVEIPKLTNVSIR